MTDSRTLSPGETIRPIPRVIDQISREIISFLKREERKKLYNESTVNQSRNAAIKEITYIQHPRLDEIEGYIDQLQEYIKKEKT